MSININLQTEKSVLNRYFIKGIFILLISGSSSMSCLAQDLPEKAYESQISIHNFKAREVINKLLMELESIESGSLKEAYYSSHLGYLYSELDKKDSADYYFQNASNYWDTTDISEENQDFFGQHLLMFFKLSFDYPAPGDLIKLDSAAAYVTNDLDKQFIKALRWRKTSLTVEKNSYVKQLDELINNDTISEDLKNVIKIFHSADLFQVLQERDSGMRLVTDAQKMTKNFHMKQVAGFLKVRAFLLNGERSNVRKELLSMRQGLEDRGVPLSHKKASMYNQAMAINYYVLQQYDSAIVYKLKVLESYKDSNKDIFVVTLYHDIGAYSRELGDFEKAEMYLTKALDPRFEEALELNIDMLAACLNQLMEILLDAYDYTTDETLRKSLLKKIEERIDQQEEHITKSKSQTRLMRFRLNKGKYLTRLEEYDLAETELKQYLSYTQEKNDMVLIRWGYLYLGELYLKMDNLTDAEEIFKALFGVRSSMRNHEVRKIIEGLIECYAGLGNTEQVKAYLTELRTFEKDLIKKKSDLLLGELRITEELERVNVVNEKLEVDRAAQASLMAKRKQLIVVILIGLALLVLVLFWLLKLIRKNKFLLSEVDQERKELESTNSELETMVYGLESDQKGKQELLITLTEHLNRLFNGIKGIKGFIPEVGKLNGEQTKYLDRLERLTKQEEGALRELISLNSIAEGHTLKITRVSITELLTSIKKGYWDKLKYRNASLQLDIPKEMVFLCDKELLEMLFVSLIEHGLQQKLKDEKLQLVVEANEGLKLVFSFRSAPVSNEKINSWTSPVLGNIKSYMSKVSQLKDLMDGKLQYLMVGDTHKVSLHLNLMELRPSANKGFEIDQLEIDRVYDTVIRYLVENQGFKDSTLTLASLSSSLDISSRKVSSAINTREKTNFSKFLARLRIEEVKTVLSKGDSRHLNIAGIGYEAGFNSKSTFFSAFKEFVGTTPKEYLNSLDYLHNEKDRNTLAS